MLRQKRRGTERIMSHDLMLEKVDLEKTQCCILLKNKPHMYGINKRGTVQTTRICRLNAWFQTSVGCAVEMLSILFRQLKW